MAYKCGILFMSNTNQIDKHKTRYVGGFVMARPIHGRY